MKIAFINFYSGFVNRGGETFVHELANHLSKKNDVTVFQAGPRINSTYKTISVGHFKETKWLSSLSPTHILRRLFLDSSKLREFFFTLQLLPTLKKLHPQVVIPLNSGWQALIISIYCRISGAKLVVAGQSGPGWDDRWNLLMYPHLFIALTDRQFNWANQASIWKQEIVKIPNGVDLNKFYPAGPTKLQRSRGIKFHTNLQKPIILLVAASTLDKRVEQGIRAVASLKSGSLLLLGSGPMDERINSLGYKLLGEKRFLHLSVSHSQMPEYYRAADVFTLCSYSSEAFGIVYLEAMASGLPCVATDDESRREIIGNAGVFVDNPDDVDEYSNALIEALKTKWGNHPRNQAEKFSWDEIALKYEKALAKI